MATSSYVGIDVSKVRLDVVVLGETQGKQVGNTQVGIAELVAWMQKLQPELIVMEATGGYQRGVVGTLPSWFASGGGESFPSEAVCTCVWRAGQDR